MLGWFFWWCVNDPILYFSKTLNLFDIYITIYVFKRYLHIMSSFYSTIVHIFFLTDVLFFGIE